MSLPAMNDATNPSGHFDTTENEKNSKIVHLRSYVKPPLRHTEFPFGEAPRMSSVAVFSQMHHNCGTIPSFGFPPPLPLIEKKSKNYEDKTDTQLEHSFLEGENEKYIDKTVDESNKRGKMIYCSNWRVQNNMLQRLPEHFTLERTSRLIACIDATIISTRVSECLKNRSIEATYDDEKAKAKCRNADFVEFQIRLFLGSGKDEHGIIVEVQRRSGSVVSFMDDCRAILNAADGEEEMAREVEFPFIKYPVSEMSFVKKEPCNEKVEQNHKCVRRVSQLLKEKTMDTNILGMEMFESLTDFTKTNSETSLDVAKRIFEKNDYMLFSYLSDKLFSTLYDEDKITVHDQAPLLERLQNLTLAVFSNILEVSSGTDEFTNQLNNHSLFIEKIVPNLIELISTSESHPHDSFLAAKALRLLLRASGNAKKKALEVDASFALDRASDFGHGHHLMLAKESDRCKKSLDLQ